MIFDNYENEFDQDNTPIPEMDWIRDRAKKRSDKKRVAYSTGLLATALAFFGAGMLYKQNTEPLTIASQEVENNIENNKTAQQGEDPIETVPNSQVFDETICGTELPKGIVAFPKSENNEPVKTRIENQRLIATFIDGERSFEIIWPADDEPDYLDKRYPGSHVVSTDNFSADFLFGGDAFMDIEESMTKEPFPWFTLTSNIQSQPTDCDWFTVISSERNEIISRTRFSFKQETNKILEIEKLNEEYDNEFSETRMNAEITHSKMVETFPTKVVNCDATWVKNEVIEPQEIRFDKPIEALNKLLIDEKLNHSEFVKLIESETKIAYVIEDHHSDSSQLFNPEIKNLSGLKVLMIFEVEKDESGWFVTKGELPGC